MQLQETELKRQETVQDSEDAVRRANLRIETAKANLQVYVQEKAEELAQLACQKETVKHRMELDHKALAIKNAKDAEQLRKTCTTHHRQVASVTKTARDLERQRSLKQRKLDEQKRQLEHLQNKIRDDAKASAQKEIELVRRELEAEAAAARARAKAELKEARREASRLKGKMLAEARAEVVRMQLRAQEELARPVSLAQPEMDSTSSEIVSELCETEISDACAPEDEIQFDWEVVHEMSTVVETTSIDERFCWDTMGEI